MKKRFLLAALLALLVPSLAQAWWSPDWTQRKKINVTAPADVQQPVELVAVPVRLHSGNFVFTDAKEDGADLRFVSGDDKTPLKHHIELFDSINELAIVWVQVPAVAPGATATSIWMYYGNPKAVAGDDAKGSYDANSTVVLHFGETTGLPKDQAAYGNNPSLSTATLGTQGLIGNGATFNGTAKIVVPATPTTRMNPASGFTFTAWVKPAGTQKDAVVFSQSDGARSVTVGLADGRLYAQLAGGQGSAVQAQAGTPIPSGWHHAAVTIKDKLVIYLDGKEAGSAQAALPDLGGDAVIGGSATREAGFKGDLDEVMLSNTARSSEWVATVFASQSPDGKALSFGEVEAGNAGEGSSYFAILLKAVTLDGWVVIGILMVMMVIAFWVMISKAFFIARMERANTAFRAEFKRLSGELVSIDRGDVDDDDDDAVDEPESTRYKLSSVSAMAVKGATAKGAHDAGEYRHSSLYRIYHLGVRELQHRFDLYDRAGRSRHLSAQAIGAIRASVDAGLVRESHRLNNKMVLLTIAISGGPFLGLLGTVVGVMITFAAIAAVGDVNVNSIAPGIAAALVATVAGLGVAIPALFGYNYLASRIKEISTDMQIFADEFVTKLAEDYAI